MTKQEMFMHAVSFSLRRALLLRLAASSCVAVTLLVLNAAAVAVPSAAQVPDASPAPSSSAKLNAGPAFPVFDRAANLVGGVWQCETIAGDTGTEIYTFNEDARSIELETELHASFRAFRMRETFRFDDARNMWTVKSDSGNYSGSAFPWHGYKWIFDGIETVSGQRYPVRMIYSDLADQAFRRDLQAKQDGSWKTYSAETCRRPSN